jgi:peptide/nickel transport system substrate-binding protein
MGQRAENYWGRLHAAVVSRRRALAIGLSLGTGAAAATLVGCGGGDATGVRIVGGLAEARDTSAQAVAGGVYRTFYTREADTLDVGASDNYVAYGFATYYYSRILKAKSGLGIDPNSMELDGDLAQSWEVTPDAQTWTFRLRPGGRMQNVQPLNGRLIDVEDVAMSWERFRAKSPRRQRYFMVEKVETPDAQTVVFKLNEPYAPFGVIMADTSGFWVMPKEYAREEIDGRNTAVGSGPWIQEKQVPSALREFRRNPDYFLDGLPYMERVELPLVSEYVQRLAQFKAGNIYSLTPASSDVMSVRKDVPDALMWKGDFGLGWPVIFFGRVDRTFEDIRLKRALSMSLDRDLFLDTFFDVENFRKEGLDVEVRWDNMLSCGYERWWLDPRDSKEMGYPDKPPGKWYRHDIAEAKALLSAAGHPNGLDSEAHTWPTAGAQFIQQVQATIGMWAEAGIRLRLVMDDFATVFLPRSVVQGAAVGLNLTPSGEYNEVDQVLRGQWQPGPRNPSHYQRPYVDEMITKQSITLDTEERRRILWDLQKYLSDDMNYVAWNGQASTTYSFTQPWVMNNRVFRSTPDSLARLWLDPKKAAKGG